MNTNNQIIKVKIEDIVPNRFQPRINFDKEALNELAASIKRYGIIQPLTLRQIGPKYEIIAGERRYKAAIIAGEFSKRAFLNGRIDLVEADGIINLINAKTDKARTMSINQLSGSVSNQINYLRNHLVNIISNIEVNIDYPEYEDIEVVTNEKILPDLKI